MVSKKLPKWPQMLVYGDAVTVEQAKEIIRRTDTFFFYPRDAGNDREFAEYWSDAFGVPKDMYSGPEMPAWEQDWEWIYTEYIHNTWISSCYVYGAYGWCHPDGKILFADNVGKWPSVDVLEAEWRKLVKQFPFLDLTCVLMSGEHGEENTFPIVGIRVENQEVKLFEPNPEHFSHKTFECSYTSPIFTRETEVYFEVGQCGIDIGWLEEWAQKKTRKDFPQEK